MRRPAWFILSLFLLLMTSACTSTQRPLRVAVYNIRELSTDKLLRTDEAGRGADPQLLAAAHVLQRLRPDVVLLCEIDHDYTEPGLPLELNARRFVRDYLAHGESPLRYDHLYAAPNNTGIISGHDLDGDGYAATAADINTRVYGNDCWGYGNYPGQYSMALLSRYPIRADLARTFQTLRWKDLPGNHLAPGVLAPEAEQVFRLSSKSHWDVPVEVNGRLIHLLCSHPTPQGFDGEEDRNGRRNFDEVLLWKHYLDGHPDLVDDAGQRGGLATDANFVILGDLNTDPNEGSVYDGVTAAQLLLQHPRVQETGPLQTSNGPLLGRTPGPPDFPERHTFQSWGSGGTGRIDYALPGTGLHVVGGGVYWPVGTQDLTGSMAAALGSDHRLVWVDLAVPGAE